MDARAISEHFPDETPLVKLQSFVSPDRQFRATVCFKYDNPRVDDRFWTFLVLAKNTDDDLQQAGIQIIRLGGSSAIWCNWRAANQLDVSYVGPVWGYSRSEGGDKIPEWNGVKIRYEELQKKGPNQALEPTIPGVTPRAEAKPRGAPPGIVAQL